MSAIIGIYHVDGRPVNPSLLKQMIDVLQHRGADGVGMWLDGCVGLGHRMLWTTPESLHENLPLVDQTGAIALTADARIDNRDELCTTLESLPRPAHEVTDAQIIISAYERWGENCPEKLVGDFAFALWDNRARKLFCARDHFGVKPFYYYHSEQAFIFGSEIKAILEISDVPRRLNETRIADYLVEQTEDKMLTFYKDILRLPPAHSLTLCGRRIELKAYWALNKTFEHQLASDEEYAEAFRALFTEAVRCRTRCAFSVGAGLSGGLDSSSITSIARQLLHNEGRPLHTFSAVFDEVPNSDERSYIDCVLAQGKLESHFVRADHLSPLTEISRVLWHEDVPFCIPNLFIQWGLCVAAQRAGVRVFLDGNDGDSTVSYGDGYLLELARSGQWQDFATEVKGLCTGSASSPLNLFQRYGAPYLTELARAGKWQVFLKEARQARQHCYIQMPQLLLASLRPFIPDIAARLWRRLRGRNIERIVRPEFARRINLEERLYRLSEASRQPPQTERELHYLDLTSGLHQLTREAANKAFAAFSIEGRHPFYDKRLVEFCLALPPRQKLQNGWRRSIMRRAMTGVLPQAIQWRRNKGTLAPNFMRGLLMYERHLLDDVILHHPEVIEDYVDLVALRQAYRRYQSSGDETAALSVWEATTLALWLRQTRLMP